MQTRKIAQTDDTERAARKKPIQGPNGIPVNLTLSELMDAASNAHRFRTIDMKRKAKQR